MYAKKFSFVLMVGLLLGGCVTPNENAQIKPNKLSQMFLAHYDTCLKRFAGDPAKATYECSSLYGRAAFYRGDYVEAYKTFAPLAKQSEPEAQHYLGLMYLQGNGVSKDEKLAAQLQMEAAKQGHLNAMGTLSSLYEDGAGVTKDNSEAMRWREEAARLGSSMEYYSLGIAYKAGKITKRHPTSKPGVRFMPRPVFSHPPRYSANVHGSFPIAIN